MQHEMNLQSAPFAAVKSGRKTVEMRLFDEKRSLVKTGDTVVFTNTETKETLICMVVNMHRYKNFEELYAQHDKVSIGYEEWETADPKDMLAYYPQEKVAKYGVVGIEIKLTEKF